MATYCLVLRISKPQASSFFTFPASTAPWKEALRNWCARRNWYRSPSVILRGNTCFLRYQAVGTFRWLKCWWTPCFGRAIRRSSLSLLAGVVFVHNTSLKRVLCHADVQSRDQEKLTFDLEEEELSLLDRTTLMLRLFFLVILFSPATLLQLVNRFLGSNALYSLQWWFTVSAIEIAGPAFIKLGQWASTRRDLFPEEFCDRLSTLQRRCSPHPWLATEEVLCDSFGENWKDHFTDIDRVPIGSGCVAQVYKWSLKKRVSDSSVSALMEAEEDHSSIPVAVKVLHPGIVASVKRDISLMRMVARWIDTMFPDVYWISLKESVEEFAAIMWKQLDMKVEARNLERFCRNFKDNPQVKFPTPLHPFISQSVLVETFEEGVPINDILKSTALSQPLCKQLAKQGISVMMNMMFQHNFVHGDLHPGNILVQFSSSDPSPNPSLVLLDCGIVSELSERDRKNFRAVFTAIVQRDGEKVADLMLENARYSDCSDPEAYRKQMGVLVSTATSHLNLREVDIGGLFSDLFLILITHRVKIESNFAAVLIAIMVLEGLGRSLDSTLDILSAARPFILQEAKKGLVEHFSK